MCRIVSSVLGALGEGRGLVKDEDVRGAGDGDVGDVERECLQSCEVKDVLTIGEVRARDEGKR